MRIVKEPEAYADVYRNEEELKAAVSEYYRIAEGTPSVYAVTLHEEDYPVMIRSPKEGDRIRLRFGTKKVSRFFIDRHIHPYRRLTWPVLVNACGEVILVPGLGCDVAHYSVNPVICVIK